MIYGYARVSTAGQGKDGNSLEAQDTALREAGASIIYSEVFTGTRISRPEFDKLRKVLVPGDTLIVTKLDRFARTAAQGATLIEELISAGVRVHVLNMGVMDDTPTGRLIRNIMFAFAEFERDMIVQRTTEGKETARKKEGYKEGRPKKTADPERLRAIRDSQRSGDITAAAAAKLLGMSRSTYYQICKEQGI